MVAERTADVPGAGAFPYEAHEMEMVFLADIIGTDCPAPLGNGQADIERTPGYLAAADKLGRAPHMLYRQRPPAGRAAAKIEFLCRPIPDVIPDHLLVCLELVECCCSMLRDSSMTSSRVRLPSFICCICDSIVWVMSGLCDRIGVVLERLGHDPAYEGRAQRVTFHVLTGNQFCNHFVPVLFVPSPSSSILWISLLACTGPGASSPFHRG